MSCRRERPRARAALPGAAPIGLAGRDRRRRRRGPRAARRRLAHRGVLFLDELPEFRGRRSSRCGSRSRTASSAIVRVGGRAIFPARFQLVGTMNLCPCGARGDPGAACACTAQRLPRYRERLSRALLDRFDLALTVPRPRGGRAGAGRRGGVGGGAARVAAARTRLAGRASAAPGADELLTRAVERLPLSGRGRARVARVAGTIAALARPTRRAEHLAEALSYRPPTELRR